MAEADFTKPLPQITSEAQPFWNTAAKQQLVMQRCQDCHAYIWTPRPACFECGSERLEWTQLSGKGEIYSFTVIRQVVGRAASQKGCASLVICGNGFVKSASDMINYMRYQFAAFVFAAASSTGCVNPSLEKRGQGRFA